MCSNHKDAINSNEHLRAVRAYHSKLHKAMCFQHNIQVWKGVSFLLTYLQAM